MKVLEVKDLHKSIGNKKIIKGISFSIDEGQIFGFLGPNGAGKTTTIRMIVGLIAPNKGNVTICDYDVKSNKEAALKNVGAVVENPELYTYMTGMQNLMQIARIDTRITKEHIENVIDLVGLKERINDKVKKYSLGMKQRLGIAEALLSSPKLLILDEPTNGLDPSGIKEFRDLIKRLAKEKNMAVFVSSHLLSEIQQLCDTVAFIDHGEIKSIESITSSLSAVNDVENIENIILSTPDIEKCKELITNFDYINNFSIDNSLIQIKINKGYTPQLVIDLTKNNIPIEEVYKKQQALEDRYMQLVEGGIK